MVGDKMQEKKLPRRVCWKHFYVNTSNVSIYTYTFSNICITNGINSSKQIKWTIFQVEARIMRNWPSPQFSQYLFNRWYYKRFYTILKLVWPIKNAEIDNWCCQIYIWDAIPFKWPNAMLRICCCLVIFIIKAKNVFLRLHVILMV